jgi:hypothetical protein
MKPGDGSHTLPLSQALGGMSDLDGPPDSKAQVFFKEDVALTALFDAP